MRGEVTFTMKEVTRYRIVQRVLEGKIVNKEAASALGLSIRQVKRLKRKVEHLGPAGVLHGNKGRVPAHAYSPEERSRVIAVAEERYFDFNFSHLSEMLEKEEGIRVNRETLRLWLRPRGFGGKARRMPKHRRRRTRSTQEGKMLFLDGSPHQWFGEEESTLILCTDDATGNPLCGRFQQEEDLDGCLRVCLDVFRRYGLPGQFYLDCASQFTTTRHGGLHASQDDREPTQFERAMRELGIGLIFAYSPQARGRAERINGTFQDRLVAELRLKGIHNAHDATRYLTHHFIPRYCRHFGLAPRDKTPAWRDLPQNIDIRNILCKRFQRTVNNDNTISVNGRIIQLLPSRNRSHFVKAKVQVNLWTNGTWHVFHPQKGEIPCIPITAKPISFQRTARELGG